MAVTVGVLGVDVGGTNTDAVIIDKSGPKPKIISQAKTLTTSGITSGVSRAIQLALQSSREEGRSLAIQQVNIGTTHFINAIIEGKQLVKVAVIRLCGTASKKLPPFSDFSEKLKPIVQGSCFLVNGGYQFDGKEITTVDENEIKECIRTIKTNGEKNIVVSGVFSPVCQLQEDRIVELIKQEYPEAGVTASHTIGKLGLLERENAAILNECIKPLCRDTIRQFRKALCEIGLKCPFYLTQNDGTVLSEDMALKTPVLSFASGATNSMRGAMFLSGIKDGIIVDIGGTSTDVGVIIKGYPRMASAEVKIGGIRTNFRMPDVVSIGLGGGSYVVEDRTTQQVKVGPLSAGYRITSEALVFAEDDNLEDRRITTTDIAVASDLVTIGNKKNVGHLEERLIKQATDQIHELLSTCVDQMRFNDRDLPMVLVGGGSVIINKERKFDGISNITVPNGFDVANAAGAALCQISATSDRVMDLEAYIDADILKQSTQDAIQQNPDLLSTEIEKLTEKTKLEYIEKSREAAFDDVYKSLRGEVIDAGGIPDSITVLEKEDVSLAYIPGFVKRVKMKVVGDLEIVKVPDGLLVADFVYGKAIPEGFQNTKQTVSTSGKILSDESTLVEITEPNINTETGEWLLSKYDIECLAIGAGIMGCGGGGNPRMGRLLALDSLDRGKSIRLITPSKFCSNETGFGAIVAYMGAPLVIYEKLVSGNETINALKSMGTLYSHKDYDAGRGEIKTEGEIAKYVKADNGLRFIDDLSPISTLNIENKSITAILCAEVGGMNCLEPLIVGAEFGLPVVDCDGMGRAFPELQMFVPFICGFKPYPCTLADDKGRKAAVLFSENPKRLEDHFRQVVVSLGCSAGITFRPLTSDEVMKSTVLHSYSHAWRIGDTVLRARAMKQSPVKAIVDLEKGKVAVFGKITDVFRETTGGFNKGKLTIDGLDDFNGRTFTIEFQNEFLVCYEVDDEGKKHVSSCVPDLISILDADTAQPIPTEEVRFGIRVVVILLRVHPLMTSDEALKYVGPQAFGLSDDVIYTPLGDFLDRGPIGPM